MIAEQSAARGAEYIDLATPSKGHDSCRAPSDKWVEGYVPTAAAAPPHPDRRGASFMARPHLFRRITARTPSRVHAGRRGDRHAYR